MESANRAAHALDVIIGGLKKHHMLEKSAQVQYHHTMGPAPVLTFDFNNVNVQQNYVPKQLHDDLQQLYRMALDSNIRIPSIHIRESGDGFPIPLTYHPQVSLPPIPLNEQLAERLATYAEREYTGTKPVSHRLSEECARNEKLANEILAGVYNAIERLEQFGLMTSAEAQAAIAKKFSKGPQLS